MSSHNYNNHMLRGEYYCICPACWHVFKGLDIEVDATVKSMPVHCPKCRAEAVKVLPVIRLFHDKEKNHK